MWEWEEDYPVPAADLPKPPLPRFSRRQITEFMRDTITFDRFTRHEATLLSVEMLSMSALTSRLKPFTLGPSAQHRIAHEPGCTHVTDHATIWAIRQLRLQFARRMLGERRYKATMAALRRDIPLDDLLYEDDASVSLPERYLDDFLECYDGSGLRAYADVHPWLPREQREEWLPDDSPQHLVLFKAMCIYLDEIFHTRFLRFLVRKFQYRVDEVRDRLKNPDADAPPGYPSSEGSYSMCGLKFRIFAQAYQFDQVPLENGDIHVLLAAEAYCEFLGNAPPDEDAEEDAWILERRRARYNNRRNAESRIPVPVRTRSTFPFGPDDGPATPAAREDPPQGDDEDHSQFGRRTRRRRMETADFQRLVDALQEGAEGATGPEAAVRRPPQQFPDREAMVSDTSDDDDD